MEAERRFFLRALVDEEQKARWEATHRLQDKLDREAGLALLVSERRPLRKGELMPSKGGEVQELIAHVRKAGYKVVRSGSQRHYKIQDSKGAVMTDDNGPIIISTSPSDHRWREMHVQRMMRAGILKSDPYKATGKQSRGPKENGAGGQEEGKGKRGSHLQDEEVRERARAAAARVRDQRSSAAVEGTAKLRARFEPLVPHLGGWAQGAGPRAHLSLTDLRVLTVTELAAVIRHWAASRGRLELPKMGTLKAPATTAQVEAGVRGLKSGGTVSEKWQPLIDVFLDDLWRDAGNDPRQAAQRYLHLLREQKGIIEPPESPAPLPPRPLVPVAPAPEPAPEEPLRLGPAFDVAAPQLALRVAYWAGRGGCDEGEAAELAAKVAEMEFSKQKEDQRWNSQESQSSSPGGSSGSAPPRLTRRTSLS